MNRKLSLAGVHRFGSHHGKLFSHVSIRGAIWIALVVAGLVFFPTEWLDSPAPASSSSPQLIQQMIWNPSPK